MGSRHPESLWEAFKSTFSLFSNGLLFVEGSYSLTGCMKIFKQNISPSFAVFNEYDLEMLNSEGIHMNELIFQHSSSEMFCTQLTKLVHKTINEITI